MKNNTPTEKGLYWGKVGRNDHDDYDLIIKLEGESPMLFKSTVYKVARDHLYTDLEAIQYQVEQWGPKVLKPEDTKELRTKTKADDETGILMNECPYCHESKYLVAKWEQDFKKDEEDAKKEKHTNFRFRRVECKNHGQYNVFGPRSESYNINAVMDFNGKKEENTNEYYEERLNKNKEQDLKVVEEAINLWNAEQV